jgi:hypothetical protein
MARAARPGDLRGLVCGVQHARDMALREFKDRSGVAWHIWETVPERTEGLSSRFRHGWLTFDNGRDRRRLAPIPMNWEALSTERLGLLLRVADTAGPHDAGAEWREEDRRTAERRVTERRLGERRAGARGAVGTP